MSGAAEVTSVELPQGTLRYREAGSGPPVVMLHGVLVDGRLWRKVTPKLDGHRCVVPDLPLGAHRIAMRPDADLSPPGLARLVADFLAALDLDDVTLVGNDTGGAIAQLVAVHHPERIGRLVLTDCDAFDHFLPPLFRGLQYAARVPGALSALMQGMRSRRLRRLPVAFGWLIKGEKNDELLADWTRPYLEDPGVRRDAIEVLKGISPRYTNEAAERLRSFDRPTLIVWSREDRVFKPALGERLAATIPGARLEWVDDSYTFVPEDQPVKLAELIGGSAMSP